MPPVRPLHDLALFVAIPLLSLAKKFLVVAFDLLQIIIRKLPPLLLQLTFELHPFPLHLFCIHGITLLCVLFSRPRIHGGVRSSPRNRADGLTHPDHAARAVRRPVTTWIATSTTPITNSTQEIWTAMADTPATFRAPAINPTTRN